MQGFRIALISAFRMIQEASSERYRGRKKEPSNASLATENPPSVSRQEAVAMP